MKSNTRLLLTLATLLIATLTIVTSSKAFMKKSSEANSKKNIK